MSGKFKCLLIVLLNLLLGGTITYSQSANEEKHTLVALRMIGHQILLDSGDSTSRVFPIEKEGESYKIQFASAFAFNPGDLVATIDRVVKQMKLASTYIVEVKKCESREIVYSYEAGDSINPELLPCAPRFQSKACYMIFFTILSKVNLNVGTLYHAAPIQPTLMDSHPTVSTTTTTNTSTENKHEAAPVKTKAGYSMIALQIGSVFALLGLVVYFRKKKQATNASFQSDNPEIVLLGNTRFDQKNMVLIWGNEKTELSSKESDLLSLLYSHVNKTIEREQILKVVWGDEGDYIGRTLDVFVSKLRKKLESDERVKIVNIRGIGYKFIVN